MKSQDSIVANHGAPVFALVALMGILPAASSWAQLAASTKSGGIQGNASDPVGGCVMVDQDDARAGDCMGEADRALLADALRRYERDFGPLSRSGPEGTPPLYRFFPMGATSYRDLLQTHFVDVAAPNSLDFSCGAITYSGHTGIDSSVRNGIGPQLIGVPVLAAADGVVVTVHDGEPDTNACGCGGAFPAFPPCPPGTVANSVSIDHGGGRLVWYGHLRTGSVAVTVGQQVKAGQQIGLVGSSGCSTGPHLHFGSFQEGELFEPFAGACRPGESGWETQEPLNMAMYLRGCAPSRTEPGAPYPTPVPADRQILLSDPLMYFRISVANLPAASTWQVQFVRPNGTIGYTSAVTAFGNPPPIPYRRFANFWWWFTVMYVQQIPGTWHIRLYINGTLQIEFPVDCVAELDPNLNQPPVAVSAALEPASPSSNDAIFCRVSAPLVLDDPDYNLVRYRYQWRVNGHLVRDIVSAGHADAIAKGIACAGALVECNVTPNDGSLDGPAAVATALVSGESNGDINCDGVVNVNDLLAVITAWGPCAAPCPPSCPADVTHDCSVDVNDLLRVVTNWG